MQMLVPIIAGFAGLVAIVLLIIFELRKTPKQEAEMIEHEDEAMSIARADDPRDLAKWVP